MGVIIIHYTGYQRRWALKEFGTESCHFFLYSSMGYGCSKFWFCF